MTYFSSGRLSRPYSSQEACSSQMRTRSSIQTKPRVRAVTVTCERWLCAPYSEMSLEQGHRLVTGTTTFMVNRYSPCSISPTKVTS